MVTPPPMIHLQAFYMGITSVLCTFFYQKNDILMFLFLLLTEILRSMGATQSWKDDAGSEK